MTSIESPSIPPPPPVTPEMKNLLNPTSTVAKEVKAAPPPPPLPEENTSPVREIKEPKKWETVEVPIAEDANIWRFDESWELDPSSTHVIHSFDNPLPWDSAIGVKGSSEGSEGVYFVELKDAGILVLKGSMTIGADLFANNLALHAGLEDVPKMKAVSYLESAEWDPMQQILWKLERTNQEVDTTHEVVHSDAIGTASSKLSKCLNRPFLLLMEFIRGCDLEQLVNEDEGRAIKQLLQKPSVLDDIGHLIAFDMFVNNWDRFPFVWRHDGNPKNLMLNRQRQEVFGIDHSVTSIDPELYPENCQEYIDNVRDAIEQIIQHPKEESPNTKRVREFIKQHTYVDIGLEGSLRIQKGLLRGVKKIAESLDEEKLKQMKDEIEAQLQPTVDALGLTDEATGLNRVNLNFLNKLIKVFHEENEKLKNMPSI